MAAQMANDSKTLDRIGVVEVLELHRIRVTATRWVPYGLQGVCDCGWAGELYEAPMTSSDYEPSRVKARRECLEHIADVLFEEASSTNNNNSKE